MRTGEFGFYLMTGTLALVVTMMPRGSLLAATLFVAIAAVMLVVALDG
jgi:hypothetical protein